MKLKILKYIFICCCLSIVLSNFSYRLMNNMAQVGVIFFVVILYINVFFASLNMLIFFINIKNYYYLAKILMFVPQLICAFIFLILDSSWKESLVTLFAPFFIFQIFFYFKIKKIFSIL